jgi:hypothetical protein
MAKPSCARAKRWCCSSRARAGELRVLGMGMGVLRVVRPPNGAPRLLRQLDDAALLDAQGRVLPALDESLSFDELRAAIGRARQAP